MILLNFLIFTFFAFSLFSLSQTSSEDVHEIQFKYIRCNTSKEYFHNYTCFAKSYSRTMSTINIKAVIIKPITFVAVRFGFVLKFTYEIKNFLRLKLSWSTNMGQSIAKWCIRLCSTGANWWTIREATRWWMLCFSCWKNLFLRLFMSAPTRWILINM